MSYSNLLEIVHIIQETQECGADFVTCTSGIEGSGKSTCNLQLLMRIMGKEKDIDRRFNLERNVAYTANETDSKIRNVPDGTGINIDEGGRLFYKRLAMTRKTIQGITLFQQIRFKHLASFICIPPFFSLDAELRNERVALWIQIVSRGHAMYFLRDENAFANDPWHTKENQKIIAKAGYKGPKSGYDVLVDAYRKTVNFVGEFEFPRLPIEIEARYSAISHERKLVPDEPVSISKNERAWKERAKKSAWLLDMAGYSRRDIQDLWACPATTIKDVLFKLPLALSVPAWANKPEMSDAILPWRKNEEIGINAR